MSDVVVHAEALTKWCGRRRGILALDLDVERAEVFGFLGLNGAGKTTTIRPFLDLIRPTSWAFLVGIDTTSNPVATRRRVGCLPGESALFNRLTGGQTLTCFGHLHGGVHRRYQASAGASAGEIIGEARDGR